jgi:23S rRNA (pseudouridine1915-N3)-methyltransferase
MDVSVSAVGRLKAGPERDLCARYLDRARAAGGRLGLRGFLVREIPESRAKRAEDRLSEEAAALLAVLGSGERVVCLDAGGELVDSDGFAKMLAADAAAGIAGVTFIIGGADGLGEAVRSRAERRISFGRVTWPHQIARILLAEQLYRAVSILSGHPYHRA